MNKLNLDFQREKNDFKWNLIILIYQIFLVVAPILMAFVPKNIPFNNNTKKKKINSDTVVNINNDDNTTSVIDLDDCDDLYSDDDISNDINDFNARARNGSFESVEQFHQEREALIQRQSVQRVAYQEIMNYISDTNALVNEYNNNIARKTSLYKSIDSKIDQPDDTTEE